MPNFRGKRFTNAHETLIWAARDRANKTLHLQLRCDEGAERGPADALRLAAAALHRRRAAEGRGRQEGASDAEAGGAAVPLHHGGVQSGRRRSSIRSSAPARPAPWRARLGRRFIGLERDPDYAAIARKRIAEIEPLAGEDVTPKPSKRSEPRIAVRRADRGGAAAARHDAERPQRPPARPRACRRHRCRPSNALGDHRGSIHQVGAAVQGAPACNGWTFWHVDVAGAPPADRPSPPAGAGGALSLPALQPVSDSDDRVDRGHELAP